MEGLVYIGLFSCILSIENFMPIVFMCAKLSYMICSTIIMFRYDKSRLVYLKSML